jgi:hypothetical protein
MTSSEKARDRRLATLGRLRELQLEEARVVHAAKQADVDRQRERVSEIQGHLDRSQARARELVELGVAAAMLIHLHEYESWQASALAEEQMTLRKFQELEEEARAQVARRFEALSCIGRVRARLAREAALSRGRREYKTLDEQAPIRWAAANRPDP